MNIEIANRLVQLRKDKNFSQEALASELGISRQAVSKWERAEASPDTDNLILLAKLYGISLDDLLKTDQSEFESGEPIKEESKDDNDDESNNHEYNKNKNGDYVHISLKEGIHVKEKDGDEVHVGWDGIHVHSKKKGDEFHLDKNGIYVDGKKYDKDAWQFEWENHWFYHYDFPIGVIISVLYIYIGIVYNAWHPGWLIFGIIPIFHSMISAFKHRDILRFAFPVLILMIIGYYGFIVGTWYPYWLLVLTIPVFYSVFGYLKYLASKHTQKQEDNPL